MGSRRQYRLVFDDPPTAVVVTATGAMGREGTEVYTDDTGAVRVEVTSDGAVRTVTTTLSSGPPRTVERLA